MGTIHDLAPYVLRYSVVGGGLVVGAAYAGSLVAGYAFGAAALVLALAGLMIGPLLFATSDEGLEAAAAGGEAGFQGVTDPRSMQPDDLAFPGKGEFGLLLLGTAGWALVGLALVL